MKRQQKSSEVKAGKVRRAWPEAEVKVEGHGWGTELVLPLAQEKLSWKWKVEGACV